MKADKSVSVRMGLTDITNSSLTLPPSPPPQKSPLTPTSKSYVEKLLQENAALIKLIEERNKMAEASEAAMHKLGVNFQKLQAQNTTLAKSNTQILTELNAVKDKLRVLQHELACKNAVLKARNIAREVEKDKLVMKLESIRNGKVGDEMATEMQRLRSQVDHLEAELQHNEASNQDLRRELQKRQTTCEHLIVEKDKLIMKLESIRNGKVGDEIDADVDQDTLLRKLAKSSGSQRNALPSECNKDLGDPKYNNMRKQENPTSTMFMKYMDISEADDSSSYNDSNDLVGCLCSEDIDISEAGNSGSDDDYSDLVGCSCTELSYCKTARCQCLVEGSYCGKLCGCVSTKCTNQIMSKGTAQHDSELLAKANAPKPSRRKK